MNAFLKNILRENKIQLVMCLCFIFLFSITVFAYASDDIIMLTNPLDASGAGTLSDLLNKIISYLTMISIPIITIMALYGGFQMLLAQDNAKKFEEGMKTLKHAALGAAVVIVADGVLYIVQSVLSLT